MVINQKQIQKVSQCTSRSKEKFWMQSVL